MPNNDLIQSFVNVPQVQSEIDVLTTGLNSIRDSILNMPQIMSLYKGASGVSEGKQAYDELNASILKSVEAQRVMNTEVEKSRVISKQKYEDEQASLEQLIATRIKLQNSIKSYSADEKENIELLRKKVITQDEYNARLVESNVVIERHKTRLVDLNARIKENTANAVIGKSAYKALSDQYNAAALSAKNYSITLGATHPETLKAVENAKQLNNKLKEIDASVGQGQRNVGDYSGALEKAFGKATNLSSIAARSVQMLSRQIIGLGVGMLSFVIGAKAIEFVGELIAKAWNDAHEAMNQFRQRMQLLNDVAADGHKRAGEQLTDLKLLYKAATDQKNSIEERTKAVKTMNDEFDNTFKKFTAEEILLGKAKKAYDDLTQSIIATSRAKAGKDKLDDIERQRLDNQFMIQKIKNANAQENNSATDLDFQSGSYGGSAGQGLGSGLSSSHQSRAKTIELNNKRAQLGLDKVNKANGYLDAQEKSIIDFVGEKNLVHVIEQDDHKKPKKEKKVKEDSDHLAEEYRKKDLETLMKASKDEVQILKDKYRQEADDQNASIDKRYAAESLYREASIKLIQEEKNSSIALLNEEIKGAEGKAGKLKSHAKQQEALTAIHKYEADKRVEIEKLSALEIEKANADDYKKRVRLAEEHQAQMMAIAERQFKNNQDIIAINKDSKVMALNKSYAGGGIGEEDYAIEKKKIEEQAAKDELEIEIKKDQALLFAKRIVGIQDLDIEKSIHDKKLQLSQIETDTKIANEKRANAEKVKLANEAYQIVTTLVDGSFTKNLNGLQDQIDANTKLKDVEIQRVNDSTLSEQDKAAKIIQINASAQAKQDQLDKKKREVQTQQAKFDRDAQILSIIGNALVANQKFKGQAGIFGIPIALENDIEAALQVALLLAKPLPKFEKGTSSSPEGLALTDEKGAEGYITPSGKMFLGSDKPNIKYLERGTQIIPHDEMNRMMMASMMRSTASMINKDSYNDRVENAVMWGAQEMIKQMKKQKTKVVVNNKIDPGWEMYLNQMVRH